MKIIGLTGSIASGKSTVSAILREAGAHIIDADLIARQVVEPGTPGEAQVRGAFPAVFAGGMLDRRALGRIVFSDPRSLARLNAITHPLIREEIARQIGRAREEDPAGVAVIDAAVLLESGMADMAEEVWLVVCGDEVRLSRILERDGLTEEEARARMASQMPQQEKRKYARRVIDTTSGALEETRRQALACLRAAKGE